MNIALLGVEVYDSILRDEYELLEMVVILYFITISPLFISIILAIPSEPPVIINLWSGLNFIL